MRMSTGNVSTMVTPLTPDDPAALGAYRLAGRLGEGGQGVVYLAHDPSGEQVAVKLLSTGDKDTRARLARELEALESIASFCTARVLDASIDGPRPYVVSEFVDGPSLADRVRSLGPLRGGDLERLVVGTATALAAIHAAGVVHRDFKPANVLLGPDGPRVVDFGIARAEGAATMTSGLIGTPAYLSPEQINGTPAGPASDVFAWAATMVFAATGVSPFGAETVPAAMQRVLYTEPDLSPLPARLRGLIAAALTKDPAHRPAARDLMVTLIDPKAAALPGAGGQHGLGGPYGAGSAGTGGVGGPHADVGGGLHGMGDPRAGGVGGMTGMPPGGPPFRTGPQAAPYTTQATRSRRRGALVGGIAAVVALAAGGTVFLMNQGPGPGAIGIRSSSAPPSFTGQATVAPPSSDETSQAQTSPPAGKVKIPADFAGTWKGKADGRVADKEFNDQPVTVVLFPAKGTGTWESNDPDDPHEDPGCTKGTLRPVKAGGSSVTFNLEGLTGTCAAYDLLDQVITITLTRKAGGTLDYAVALPMFGPSSRAVLTKSG